MLQAPRGEFEHGLAIALFHPAVVLEEGDVVDGALDAGDQAELVVELEAGGAYGVADAGAWMRVEKSLPTLSWKLAVSL
jgi:hypothetical protein